MSKSNDNPNLTVATPAEEPQVVEKQNLAKRAFNFVKSHKKAALAVAGLVVLVGASAALGGSSDSTPETLELEFEGEFVEPETDTTVTN